MPDDQNLDSEKLKRSERPHRPLPTAAGSRDRWRDAPLSSGAVSGTVKPSSVSRIGRCGFERHGPNQMLVDSIRSSSLVEALAAADGFGDLNNQEMCVRVYVCTRGGIKLRPVRCPHGCSCEGAQITGSLCSQFDEATMPLSWNQKASQLS